jgi:hypothetical protein
MFYWRHWRQNAKSSINIHLWCNIAQGNPFWPNTSMIVYISVRIGFTFWCNIAQGNPFWPNTSMIVYISGRIGFTFWCNIAQGNPFWPNTSMIVYISGRIFFSYLTDFRYFPLKIVFRKLIVKNDHFERRCRCFQLFFSCFIF